MDAFMPSYIWYIVPVVIGVFVLFTVFRVLKPMLKGQADTRRLLQTGTPAPGRVLQVQPTGTSVTVGGHRQPEVFLLVEIHPPGAQPYQAQIRTLISEFQIPQVQPGAQVEVRYDPRDPTKVALAGIGGAVAPQAGGIPLQGAPQGAAPVPMAAPPRLKMNAGIIIGIMGALVGVGVAMYVVFVNVGGVGLGAGADDGVCGQAAACCRTIQAKSGNAETAETCDNLNKIGVPEEACRQSLDAFRKSAETLGVSCD